MVPLLLRLQPDVVYFSEWHVGRCLAVWKRVSGQRFRLVMCNGSSAPGPYDHLDLVQQLTPGALEWVLARGADPTRNVVLPLGANISSAYQPPTEDERRKLRERLGLPEARLVIISVAALNRQKRLDYIIDEVASMPAPRPFLLVAGQEEQETPALRELAETRLGRGQFSFRTVPGHEVSALLRASDVFVLASVFEGLPRALIEAMAEGLPCIVHSYPPMEFVVTELGLVGDLEEVGTLRRLLTSVDESLLSDEARTARHRSVYRRFSWDMMRPRYVELLQRCHG